MGSSGSGPKNAPGCDELEIRCWVPEWHRKNLNKGAKMPEMDAIPAWVYVIGAPVGFFAFRFLWPLMKQSVDTQVAQGRAESGLLAQVMLERDKALARADAAEKRADDLFKELADVKAQITVMSYQLEVANGKIEALTTQISAMAGGLDA